MNASMKTILFSILIGIAACGGGGKKPAQPTEPTPTETPTPVAKTDATTPPAKEEPAPPPEPPKPDPEAVKKQAMDAELAAFEKAKPVFEKNCAGCHGKGRSADKKKLASLDIKEYPFKGKHANAADIRKALGIGGGKATMPKGKPGSVKGEDLDAITAWADAYDAAETAGAHPAPAAAPAKP
jgi:mono/diheme cytochrome c family protein